MAEESSNSIPWKPILYVGGGIAAYFAVIKPLFETLGVKDSKEDEEIRDSEKMPGWKVKFWADAVTKGYVKKNTLVGNKYLTGIAFGIWKSVLSKGTLQDQDEAAALTEIKKLDTQAQLSFVSYLLSVTYKKNLFDGLREKLSDGEMAEVVRTVKNLPLYKPKTITGLPVVW